MTLKVHGLSLERAYREFNDKLSVTDDLVATLRADCASVAVDIQRFWSVIDTINKVIPIINALLLMPGVPAYIASQGGSATPGADWIATRTAMLALRDGINNMIPVDGSGFELVLTKQANGSRVTREFNTIETNPLLTLCDDVTNSLI